MNDADKFWDDVDFGLFVMFSWLALLGFAFLGLGLLIVRGSPEILLVVAGVLCVVPMLMHGALLTIWHWKSRYKGSHSKLWGAVLLLENSGWVRLIYFLRHVLPDRRRRGRYAPPTGVTTVSL